MKTPILFSDIDLCLSSYKWFQSQEPIVLKPNETLTNEQHEKIVDPKCLKQINRILDSTGANIVISSHVRLYLTLDEIKRIFLKAGLKKKFENNIIDKTPLLGSREDNITWWVNKHKDEISNWAIIDDKKKKDFKNTEEHFIHISPKRGLGIEEANKVIKILNKS